MQPTLLLNWCVAVHSEQEALDPSIPLRAGEHFAGLKRDF
jgi:hypothetical protein